ncbi:MAG: hypothetical protein M1326_04270 [Cyanobacteria bacterium]|nr:hypothetical protein [Cyanobacteriota bacterium]
MKNKKPLFIIISFSIIVFSIIAPLLCICCKINFNNTLNSETTKTNKNKVESSTTSILNNIQKQNTSSSNKLNLLNFRGIDFYPYPVPYSDKETANSLAELLNIQEINYIQLRFFLYQSKINSNKVTIDESQDASLIALIKQIHKSGKKVSLMPHLIVDNDKIWAGLIKPANEKDWFNSYKEAIMHYAKIAENENVELFSVANELVSVWGKNDEWKPVVKAIRNIYNGKLTAKMNRWYQESQFEDILKMDWMSNLDYIGIAAYFDLTQKKDPTLQELKNSWQNNRQGLNLVQELETISNKFLKKIIFLEVGYRSVAGANIEPWNYSSKIPYGSDTVNIKQDQQEQANATQALFDVFYNKVWFDGVFWFYWPTKIIYNPNDTTWSIPGKLMEQVILDNFRRGKG